MKLALTAIAAIVVLTGAASASDLRKWPCTDLHANWMHAPEKQCGRILGNGSQNLNKPTTEVVITDEPTTDVTYVE